MELTAEQLFERHFRPHYPEQADLAAIRTTDANPANNPHILAQLEAIADTFAGLAPAALEAPDLVLDRSDASVHRLAAQLTRSRRDALLASGDLVHLVTHGAIYVGACVVACHEGRWLVRSPLWESLVELSLPAGTAHLAPFQWWLKALADAEIDEPRLADRYHLHVEIPTTEPEGLPRIAAPRPLPRLKQPRYDTLVKYLQKHLPELRGVGSDFPTPDKFTNMAFHWLDFRFVGDGRMLLLHGPSDEGVHLFWLDAAGFVRAAYFPADAAPDPVVEEDGDRLVVTVSILGQPQRHEMLWWGPTG